ncbi:MAG: ABC transporter permease [Thermoproteota archaeon]
MSEKQEITFPFSEAFRFSIESIRRRFTRALITVISVVLGIAFLVALLTMADITIALNPGSEGEALPAYQLWMAVIALLVCGVGIVNSMLMSITERYKEIGTIKCLGAMDRHVLELFLIESCVLGLLGGLLGSVTGWGAALGLFINSGRPEVLSAAFTSIRWVAYAILISVVLSFLASVVPAYIAAKLNPAEALRYEV